MKEKGEIKKGETHKTGNLMAECRKRISDSHRVRYLWAMAPTINKTKLVATAIATFASTDKFIIFPAIVAAIPITPVFEFFLFLIASNFSALMDARRSVRRTKN